MQFHFLGTSAGSPTVERNVTALGMNGRGWSHWWLFDCGEGTQQRLLRTHLAPPRLERIFLTHLHGDHCYGLFGLITSRGLMCGGDDTLWIHGPKGTKELVETVLRLSYVRMHYPIVVEEYRPGETVCHAQGIKVTAVKNTHDIPSCSFLLAEDERPGVFLLEKAKAAGIPAGPLYGRLQRGEPVELPDGRLCHGADFSGPARRGRRVLIGGDNERADHLAEAFAHADLVIHEATHTEAVKAKLGHRAWHSTAASVATMAEAASVRHLILTHFSPRFTERSHDESHQLARLQEEAQAHFKGQLHLARDYDIFDLSLEGTLSVSNPRRR